MPAITANRSRLLWPTENKWERNFKEKKKGTKHFQRIFQKPSAENSQIRKQILSQASVKMELYHFSPAYKMNGLKNLQMAPSTKSSPKS